MNITGLSPDSSWSYGLGSLAAFVLPGWLLSQDGFLRVLLAYTAICLFALALICLLMTGRELVRAWRSRTRPLSSGSGSPFREPAIS
ncbi:MAG: hypothetical protein R3310_00435 [Candidatus Competibacteraceae bacterium]|nr:hypothetical protein [Candidatus Competibacteraceae bacterium]